MTKITLYFPAIFVLLLSMFLIDCASCGDSSDDDDSGGVIDDDDAGDDATDDSTDDDSGADDSADDSGDDSGADDSSDDSGIDDDLDDTSADDTATDDTSDDTASDDTSSDDTMDDDTADDDTGNVVINEILFEYVDGGIVENRGTALGVGPGSDVLHFASVKGRGIHHFRLHDDNLTEERVADFAERPSEAVDADGFVQFAARDPLDGNLLYLTNRDGDWSREVLQGVVAPGDRPAIAVGTDGNSHIAFYEQSDASVRYATNKSGSWEIETVDAGCGLDHYPGIAIDTQGRIHLSYASGSSPSAKHAVSSPSGWSTEIVDASSEAGIDSSIAIDGTGAAHVSYWNSDVNTLNYATNRTGAWHSTILDTAMTYHVGEYTTLKLDSNGAVVIVYQGEYSSNQLITKCATDANGYWEITKIQMSYYAEPGTAMTVDKNDRATYAAVRQNAGYLDYATNGHGFWMSGQFDRGMQAQVRNSFAIDRNGFAYASYFDYTNRDIRVANNKTGEWNAEILYPGSNYNYDSTDIAVDSAGFMHVCYFDDTQAVIYATDKSGTWQHEIMTAAGWENDRCRVGTDSDDAVHLLYADGTASKLIHAVNDGGGWVSEEIGEPGLYLSMAIDAQNHVHVAVARYYPDYIGYLTNRSGVWVDEENAADGAYSLGMSLAADDQGNAHLVYSYFSYSVVGGLYYSTNQSGTWTAEQLHDGDHFGQYNDIATDSDGHPHLSYWDSDLKRINYATKRGSHWSTISIETAFGSYEGSGIALEPSGKIHQLYSILGAIYHAAFTPEYSRRPALAAHADREKAETTDIERIADSVIPQAHLSTNRGAPVSIGGPVSENRPTESNTTSAGDPFLAADAADDPAAAGATPLIEWVDGGLPSAGGGGMVRTTGNRLFVVSGKSRGIFLYDLTDSSLELGEIAMFADSPSLASDASGRLYVAYRALPSHTLMYATNATGIWLSTAVDDSVDAGPLTSIAIGTDGKARIAYYEQTSQALRMATQTAGGWSLETVDGTGNAGRYHDLALDAGNQAHIAYFRDATGDLMLAVETGGGWNYETVENTADRAIAIAVGDDGFDHLAYSKSGLTYSNNRSGDWSPTVLDAASSGILADMNWDDTGNLHIIFSSNSSYSKIQYWTNASGAWREEDAKAGYRDYDWIGIVPDANGRARVACRIVDYVQELDFSSNEDGRWLSGYIDHNNTAGTYASLALDGNGDPHISYAEGISTEQVLMYAHRDDGEWRIEAADWLWRMGSYSLLALDADGHAHISYYDAYNGDLRYATNQSGEWRQETVESLGSLGTYTSIAVDNAGVAHISYQSSSAYKVKYATNAGGSWTIELVEWSGSDGGYTTIKLDNAENVHLMYYAGDDEADLKYAIRSDGEWTVETVDTRVNSGKCVAFALTASGCVHILYNYDDFTIYSGIRYATNCTGEWVTDTPNTDTCILTYNSMALDASGRIHATYYDCDNGDLRYLTNQGGAWRSAPIDTEGDVGLYTSMALDDAGMLHVAYQSEDALWYAKFPAGYTLEE